MKTVRRYLVLFLRLPVVQPLSTALLEAFISLFVITKKPCQHTFTVMQVGGRGGSDPYTKWMRARGTVRTIGVEPESSGLKKLTSTNAYDMIVTHALSDQKGSAPLFVTKAGGWCSLLKPDEQAIARVATAECLNTKPFEVIGTEQVERTTLDSLKDALPQIDYLQIDVQGAELQVLRGAETVLRNVGVIELEVRFYPLYEHEPLFPEVHAFLNERGFILFQMTRQGEKEFGENYVEANACFRNVRVAASKADHIVALLEYAKAKHDLYANPTLRLLGDIRRADQLTTKVISPA